MTDIFELTLDTSSGNLSDMANAMVNSDSFKASHPNLMDWMEEQHQHQQERLERLDAGETSPSSSDKNLNKNQSSSGSGGGGILVRSNSPNKRSQSSLRFQEPPKRRKLDPNLTVKRLVREICTSATGNDRQEILSRAKDFLDHPEEQSHNDEIAEGVDVALVKQLVLLVFKLSRCRPNTVTSVDESYMELLAPEDETLPSLIDETCSALEALEMVYRANDTAVAESFNKMGQDLLHVLVTLIDEELNRRVVPETGTAQATLQTDKDAQHAFRPIKKEDSDAQLKVCDQKTEPPPQQDTDSRPASVESTPELQRPITPLFLTMGSPEGNFLILKATKIIGNLARVGQATKPMAFFPGLISCLLNLINYQPYDSIPWEARLSALWILGNLACNPENMLMMTCTPGLIRSLVRVGCRALHKDYPMETTMEILRSRSLSSRALLNLSWKPENKIPLSENLALVELLGQLAVHRNAPAFNNSRTVRSILRQTRFHAVGALRNLAAAHRATKIHLCEYKNGHILDALTDVALNDPDKNIQNRAFAAIHNLAIHDTAERMVERPALVLALKDVLLEERDAEDDKSKDGSPRSHASATLLVLERTITPDMESYGNLRDLLDAINPSEPSENGGGDNNEGGDVQEDSSTGNIKAIEV